MIKTNLCKKNNVVKMQMWNCQILLYPLTVVRLHMSNILSYTMFQQGIKAKLSLAEIAHMLLYGWKIYTQNI